MLRGRDIHVGKCYVNSTRTIAREVIQASERTVTFKTYHLDTGNSCGSPSECPRRDFTHWAASEASPSEMERLHNQYLEI